MAKIRDYKAEVLKHFPDANVKENSVSVWIDDGYGIKISNSTGLTISAWCNALEKIYESKVKEVLPKAHIIPITKFIAYGISNKDFDSSFEAWEALYKKVNNDNQIEII